MNRRLLVLLALLLLPAVALSGCSVPASSLSEIASEFLAAQNDAVAPAVAATSLPDHGTTSTDIINRFTVDFSEDMMPSTVNDAANYELRWAGA